MPAGQGAQLAGSVPIGQAESLRGVKTAPFSALASESLAGTPESSSSVIAGLPLASAVLAWPGLAPLAARAANADAAITATMRKTIQETDDDTRSRLLLVNFWRL